MNRNHVRMANIVNFFFQVEIKSKFVTKTVVKVRQLDHKLSISTIMTYDKRSSHTRTVDNAL